MCFFSTLRVLSPVCVLLIGFLFSKNLRFHLPFFKFLRITTRKGKDITRPAVAMGGEILKPNCVEEEIPRIFQAYCKRLIHNEACDAHRELRRRRDREVTFSDLSPHEERQLATCDEYFQDTDSGAFHIAGKRITAKLLSDALHSLSEEKRKAVLLYYFFDMNDVEIGRLLAIPRRTVQYRRTSSFEQLKTYLEEHADEWDKW